jgi:hypothetical protein
VEGGKINGSVRIADARDAALEKPTSTPSVAMLR